MSKEPEGLYKSIRLFNAEQKESCMSSRLCTQITANLESLSFDISHEPRVDFDNKQREAYFSKKMEDITAPIMETQIFEQSSFEDSFYSKFKELQQKTSRVITLLPQFQSRVRNGSSLQFQTLQSHMVQRDSQINNKLKIIKDLQMKIMQLESNISNPKACKEDVLTIQKEINLNFQNYYAQTRDKKPSYNHLPENSQSMKSNNQNEKQQECPQERQNTITANQIYNPFTSYDVCIIIPNIIEIEVPIPSLKIVSTSINNQYDFAKDNSQPKFLRRSKSYSNNNNSQDSGSSIGQIIRQFNKNLKYQGLSKKLYTYQQDEPQIYVTTQELMNEQPSGFQLPLDSFEKIANNDIDDLERAYKLKPTDRSNISSTSELDKIREEIWNKECIEFNQQHLSQVRENEQKSESNEDHSLQRYRQFKGQPYDNLPSQEIIYLSKQILKIQEQLDAKQAQLAKALEKSRQFEAKSVQKQIQLFELLEKHEQLQLSHNEMIKQVQLLKKQVQQEEMRELQLKTRTISLQAQLIRVNEEKESDMQEYIKILQQKTEEMEEMVKLNHQLKEVIKKKESAIEAQHQELQSQLLKHKEEILYYKSKLEEEEGFIIDFEEASIIKDLMEHPEHTYNNHHLHKCQETINSLKTQQQASLKVIQELKLENRRLSQRYNILGSQYEIFEEKFACLIKDYHHELQQHTYALTKESLSQQSGVNQIGHEDIQAIDSIITNILKSQGTADEYSLTVVCALSRVMRRLKFCETNWTKERKERQRLTGKLKGLNLSINREIQKAEERADRFHKESLRYKHQNQQLANQLRKSQAKINQIKSQLAQSSKLNNKVKDMVEEEKKQLAEELKKSKLHAENLQYQLVKHSQNQKIHESFMIAQQSTLSRQLSRLSRVNNFELASSVVSISSKPLKMMLPKKIMAPLPPIPLTSTLPPSLTLDKLLLRRSWWKPETKFKFIIKLLDLCLELVKVSRKLFSLKPCQMMVSGFEGDIEIVVRRQFGNTTQQDENSLLYRAPEVLLGFSETQASYVWSVGVIMDQIWHEKPFYKKISQVLSRKENYEVRDNNLEVKDLLIRILRKNQKERPNLEGVKEQILSLK